ncbi:MAG: right-handed parallel beta-helix repeat-containing protein, partial [Candidatus Thorarchaeota archaeon]
MRDRVGVSICTIAILAAFVISSSCVIAPMGSFDTAPFANVHRLTVTDYTVSSPITIESDQDFEDQALANNWPGDGSKSTPYIIRNLSISSVSDTSVLVNITNTDAYFEFRDSLLSGGLWGIYLWQVSHGSVINNTIEGSAGSGVYSGICDLLTVENNTLKDADDDAHGLEWNTVYHSIIRNNTVKDNGDRGLLIDYSVNCSILENSVSGNGNIGINLRDGNTFHIENNTVYNNAVHGIEFGNCHHCNVTRNYIYDNVLRGINGAITPYLRIEENIIANNYICGASLNGDHSRIINNTFYSNNRGAVAVGATDVIVTWNNFIDNKDFETQAQVTDDQPGTIIDYNYYDDWTWPDKDPIDGIVDEAYLIMGAAFNNDTHPRVTAFLNDKIHLVTKPMIVLPDTKDHPYHTEINITWGLSSDTFGHDITYSVNYSSNSGLDWIELATDLDQTYFMWNITEVPESLNYTLRVEAKCSIGISAYRELPFEFQIRHHSVSIPTVIHPNGGELITGDCWIEWQYSQCTYGHLINSSIYFSSDGGETWSFIVDGTYMTTYSWDTTGLALGS